MIIISPVIYFELGSKVLKGIKQMRGIESLVILPVAALYFPVMSGCVRADYFMPYPMFLQTFLEKGRFIPMSGKPVGELRSVVSLDTFNPAGECFDKVFHKLRGRIGAVFLKGFYKTPSGILVDGGILEELFPDHPAVFQAGGRNKFDIHLDTLSRIIHLFIRLGDVFGIRRMDSHHALLFEKAVKAGDGAGISFLPELDPENHKPGMRVTSAHTGDQLCLIRGMLVWMVVRTPGTVAQGIPGAVKAVFPAIDILSVGLIFSGGIGNTITFSVFNQ